MSEGSGATGWLGGGVSGHADIVEGEAAESIAGYTNKHGVDLIIMAAHGRSGIGRWAWDSAADRVVRHSDVPVLIVRAPKATDCVA